MANKIQLHSPWLVAVWPGMGHVAVSSGYYLLSKLGMHAFAEYEENDLFDIDHVEVKNGIVQPSSKPRNRFYVWNDPAKVHDLVIFLGEAQPPIGKHKFCRRLIDFALELGVERVFTFAAMATQMHPSHSSRVFAAATDDENLEELKRLELQVVEDGNIGGLNGVLLAAAMDRNLQGACLLGEMPQIFTQLPFPKASLAVLEVFTTIMKLDLDLSEMQRQANAVDQQLGELLSRVEEAMQSQGSESSGEESESFDSSLNDEPKMAEADEKRIEDLFGKAQLDRSKAFKLKQELDRLGVFKDYEDRFLDLFKKASS